GFAEGDLGFDDEALSSGDDLAAAEAAMAAIQSGESVTVSGETSGVAETTNQAETTSQAEIATPETQAPAAKPAASKTAAQKPDAANAVTPKPAAETHIRVPLWRLDDMTRLVGEMIINRSAFAQRLNGFSTQIEDLQTALSRLRGVTHDVETQYSVDALRGGGDSSLGTFQSPFSRMAGGAAQESSTANGQGEHFDELEFDRYTEFHLLARTLAEATSDVGSIASECRALSGDFDALLGRWQRLTRDAQDRLMQIRMVPLRSLAPRLGRIARSTASQCNKSVHFVVRGDHTELDKTVLEEIADPLLHLIRNAVDHGIETPDERIAAGKEPQANLTIEAVNQGTQLTLRVEDDGRGLDIEKIREKAISRGLISPDQMIPTEELQMLIFAPGFSTASEVTDVSGRGVGMDVVRETVSRLGGTIRVDSVAGRGAKFLIILPTTLAVTRALIVSTGGASFAIPMQAISKISRLDPGAVSRLGNDRIIDIDGRTTRLADMAEQLALGPASDFKKPLPLLTIESGDRRAAVTVEAIEGGQDIVVKSLGDHLKSVHGLIGSTIRGDGSVIPILDPADLVGLIRDTPSDWSSSMPTQVATASRGKRHVMIVDDSVSVRRITSSVMRSGGWTVALAKDGVDALEQLHGDAGLPNIILLDMEMPRMDGLELLANLRGSDRMRDIPVVMVTSRAGDKHRKRAMEAGATEYLVKPFRDDQLLEIAGRLADSAKAAVPQMA
ncbi:MAG: response regulator, partial [Planctomycetota bacterium]